MRKKDDNWTDKDYEILLNCKDMGVSVAVEKLNRSEMSIRSKVKKLKAGGLIANDFAFYRKQRVQTQVGHDFFKTIDTKEKAYVLGFWIADGYVGTTGGCYIVGFSSIDYDHIALIRSLLCSEHKIYFSDGCHRLMIGSKEMAQDLIAMGFNNKKSTQAFLPKLGAGLIPHLVRGIFDGDGCITRGLRAKDGQPYPVICIDGTEELVSSINKETPENVNVRQHKNNLYRIMFSFKKALSVLNWLYMDSEGMRLERKYERYMQSLSRTGFYAYR